MKIAAAQLDAVFLNVKQNLIKSENIIKEAALQGAELVLLPEFFTSAIGFCNKMLDVAAESKQVLNILKKWSKEYNIIIGGSYIDFDGENAYNSFVLVFQDGAVFTHKKDIPTQFENCYYTNGDENNVLKTPIGNIGVALCWEMIRYDTVKRLYGKVDFVLCGSCWWDLPEDAPEREPLRLYNQKLAAETPVTFAKILGMPVIHAAHCGFIDSYNFPGGKVCKKRKLVGAAQIIDGSGEVITRKPFTDGEGFVIADVVSSKPQISKTIGFGNRYWIPDLPDSYINAWETINPVAKEYYKAQALPYYKSHFTK